MVANYLSFPPIHRQVFRYATDLTNSWRSLVLAGALALGGAGCTANYGYFLEVDKPTEPVKEFIQQPKEFKARYWCDKIDLKDGEYNVGVPEMPEIYSVRENGTNCKLVMGLKNYEVEYLDFGCDNTMDFIQSGGLLIGREDFAKGVNLSIFDKDLLRAGQSFVCEENKIKYY